MSRNRRRRPSLTSVVFMMILFDISAFAILIMNSETFDPLSLVAMAATVLLLIPTWFIISTFFIFLSINSFHNPLYDTAICIPSSLYTTYGFPVF